MNKRRKTRKRQKGRKGKMGGQEKKGGIQEKKGDGTQEKQWKVYKRRNGWNILYEKKG